MKMLLASKAREPHHQNHVKGKTGDKSVAAQKQKWFHVCIEKYLTGKSATGIENNEAVVSAEVGDLRFRLVDTVMRDDV
jgi:hypothetical protein